MVFKTAFELFGHEKCVNTFCAQVFYMPNKSFRLDFLNKQNHICFQWSVFRIFENFASKNIFGAFSFFYVLKICQNSTSKGTATGFEHFFGVWTEWPWVKIMQTNILRGNIKILKTLHWKPIGICLSKKSSLNNTFGM